MTRKFGKVEKGWGYEDIWASTDDYCGKFLFFNPGAQFSMHFHAKKDESWCVIAGRFLVEYIDTETALKYDRYLEVGDCWRNPPLLPHRLTCISENGGSIVEISTADSVEDNYRVMPGDSQTKGQEWPFATT